jgi:sigma-B regulation protein RsbU (phosphoserine phosphatase)
MAAIDGGMRLMLRMSLPERARAIADLMLNSASRMGELIDNVMDFARGRLGGGLTLEREIVDKMEPMLLHVAPCAPIDKGWDLDLPSDCDGSRGNA